MPVIQGAQGVNKCVGLCSAWGAALSERVIAICRKCFPVFSVISQWCVQECSSLLRGAEAIIFRYF